MDIGQYTNDYCGVDTILQLAYTYNGSSEDDEFINSDLAPTAAESHCYLDLWIPRSVILLFLRIKYYKIIKICLQLHLGFLHPDQQYRTHR